MAGRELFVFVLFAGLISSIDSDYTSEKIFGLLQNGAIIRHRNVRKINLDAGLTSRNDTTINGKTCPGENVNIVNEKCDQGSPHFDKEGQVCANDGEDNEAYCSFEIGNTVCAYCKPTDNNKSNGDNDDGGSDKNVDDDKGNTSLGGDQTTRLDEDGANDDNVNGGNDKKGDDDKGNTTSRNETTINGKTCPGENVNIVNEKCDQGSPHFDKEGQVCANDGEDNEAYCSFEIGNTVCAYCKPTDNNKSNGDNDDDGSDKNVDDDKGDTSLGGDQATSLDDDKGNGDNDDASNDDDQTTSLDDNDDGEGGNIGDYEATQEDLFQKEADGENGDDEDTDTDESTSSPLEDETDETTDETTSFSDLFEEDTTSPPPDDEDDNFSFDSVISIQQPPQDEAAKELNASKSQIAAAVPPDTTTTTTTIDVQAEMFESSNSSTNSSNNGMIEPVEDPRAAAIRAMFRFQRMHQALQARTQLGMDVQNRAHQQQQHVATATGTSAASAAAKLAQPVPNDWLPKSIRDSLLGHKHDLAPIRHASSVSSGRDTESTQKGHHDASRFQIQTGSVISAATASAAAGSGSGSTPLQLEVCGYNGCVKASVLARAHQNVLPLCSMLVIANCGEMDIHSRDSRRPITNNSILQLSRARDQAVIAYMGASPHPMNSPWNPLLRQRPPHVRAVV